MKWIEIQVTDEDIRLGTAKDCQACPVALALIRVVASDVRVSVLRDGVLLKRYGKGLTTLKITFPVEIASWIRQFDLAGTNKPAAFKIPIPEKWRKL